MGCIGAINGLYWGYQWAVLGLSMGYQWIYVLKSLDSFGFVVNLSN
jgi:hypothetical protein